MIDEYEYEMYDSADDILFYTPKIVQHIDDSDVLDAIFKEFPKLKEAKEQKNEKDERRCFIEFLQSKDIVNNILDTHSISIVELIRIYAKKHAYVFNTSTYTKKVKDAIEANGYT